MFRIIDWIERLCERIYYGSVEGGDVIEGLEYLAQPIQQPREVHHDFFGDSHRDREKKHRLEMELQNAEWILEHEKRLAKLQKRTARQRSRAEQIGVNTDRLRRLEHHLDGLRRNLSRE
jgi:hypothetical protein